MKLQTAGYPVRVRLDPIVPGFWRMRPSILTTGDTLLHHLDRMSPMFEPWTFDGR